MRLWSNVVWAQGGDHLGGSLMDLGFALEILWEPATPRLYQRLFRLRLMPKARGHESSIPPSLEFWGDLGDRIGHRWFLLPCSCVLLPNAILPSRLPPFHDLRF
jgi:hypothetical protein